MLSLEKELKLSKFAACNHPVTDGPGTQTQIFESTFYAMSTASHYLLLIPAEPPIDQPPSSTQYLQSIKETSGQIKGGKSSILSSLRRLTMQ